MREVQLTHKQKEVAPATTSDLVVMNHGKTLKEELSTNPLDQFSREVTVVSSMGKMVDGARDGAYESCVMYGRTVVNVMKSTEDITKEGNGTYSGFHLNKSGLTKELKTDTDYLFVVNVKSNTLTGSTTYSLDFGNTDPNNPTQQACFTSRQRLPYDAIGVYKFIMRTKESFDGTAFVSRNQLLNSSTGGQITFNYMVIEYIDGMEHWDIPYFEGLCDVKMPILRNVGKNLLDINKLPIQTGSNICQIIDGVVYSRPTAVYEPVRWILPVEPNTTYTVSSVGSADAVLQFSNFYNTSDPSLDARISYKGNERKTVTFTTATHTSLTISLFSALVKDLSIRNIQLEKESIATTYEDHKTNILRTSEEIVLREVNGVCDTYNPLIGEYVKRIGEIVLDGSENWGAGSLIGDTMRFGLTAQEHKIKTSSDGLCDKMPYIKWNSEDVEHVRADGTTPYGRINVWIKTNRLSTTDTQGLKQWLQQNPLTVQYELAEPVTTIVKPSPMTPFAYQKGHVILESGYEGQSLLPELSYSVPASKSGVISTTSKAILNHEQRLHKFEDLLLRENILMDYRLTLSFLDKM